MKGIENERRVMVASWDGPTRVLHWMIAILVIVLGSLMIGLEGLEAAGLDNDQVKEAVEKFHAYLGYLLAFTFILRVLWAFAGNGYARWGDILPIGGQRWRGIGRGIRWYLGGCKGEPEFTAGHDPLASLFYTAVFAVLITQALSGIVMASVEFGFIPQVASGLGLESAHGEESALAEAFEEVHEFGMAFMIFFLFAHIAGLIVHELRAKTGLLSSMVHGRKYFPEDKL